MPDSFFQLFLRRGAVYQHILGQLFLWYWQGRLDANGGQISGFCGHTFHLHIVYLQTLFMRNQAPFLRHEQLPGRTCA